MMMGKDEYILVNMYVSGDALDRADDDLGRELSSMETSTLL
jgi:hypothetical protein